MEAGGGSLDARELAGAGRLEVTVRRRAGVENDAAAEGFDQAALVRGRLNREPDLERLVEFLDELAERLELVRAHSDRAP